MICGKLSCYFPDLKQLTPFKNGPFKNVIKIATEKNVKNYFHCFLRWLQWQTKWTLPKGTFICFFLILRAIWNYSYVHSAQIQLPPPAQAWANISSDNHYYISRVIPPCSWVFNKLLNPKPCYLFITHTPTTLNAWDSKDLCERWLHICFDLDFKLRCCRWKIEIGKNLPWRAN